MHSSDEEDLERHPLNGVIQAATLRNLQPSHAQEGVDQLEPNTVSEEAVNPDPSLRKRSKKSSGKARKRQKAAADVAIERYQASDDGPSGDEVVITNVVEAPASPSPAAQNHVAPASRPLTRPVELKPIGNLQLVDSTAEIVQAVELRRLMRAPRYFDEDAGLPETSTKRCFNCGQMGHLISACNNAKRARPCYLCAQLGHDAVSCPNQLCFRCGRPGHMSRDCKNGRVEGWESSAVCCNRCGSTSGADCPCVGKGDYYRYEGGCTGTYDKHDLKNCRCYVCGKTGHLCCKPTPTSLGFGTSCYCCGSNHHLGEDCPHEHRPHITAERAGDARKALAERENEREREQYLQQNRGRYGQGMPRSQSVGMAMRNHQRWDDDQQLLPDRNWDRSQSVPRLNSNSTYTAAAAWAGGDARQRFTETRAAYGTTRYDSAGQQQQHNSRGRYDAIPSPQQYYAGGAQYQQQQYQQYNEDQSDQYTDRARSVGGYEQVYNTNQRYNSVPAPYRQANGNDYGRSRQATQAQQQQARYETDNIRSHMDRNHPHGSHAHKRSRYSDEDSKPSGSRHRR